MRAGSQPSRGRIKRCPQQWTPSGRHWSEMGAVIDQGVERVAADRLVEPGQSTTDAGVFRRVGSLAGLLQAQTCNVRRLLKPGCGGQREFDIIAKPARPGKLLGRCQHAPDREAVAGIIGLITGLHIAMSATRGACRVNRAQNPVLVPDQLDFRRENTAPAYHFDSPHILTRPTIVVFYAHEAKSCACVTRLRCAVA